MEDATELLCTLAYISTQRRNSGSSTRALSVGSFKSPSVSHFRSSLHASGVTLPNNLNKIEQSCSQLVVEQVSSRLTRNKSYQTSVDPQSMRRRIPTSLDELSPEKLYHVAHILSRKEKLYHGSHILSRKESNNAYVTKIIFISVDHSVLKQKCILI